MGFPLVFPAGAIIASLDSLSHGSLLQLLTHHWGLIATFFVFLVVRYVRSPWRRVPPGPRGLPVLGNSLQLQDKGWMFEKECKRKFGSSDYVFLAYSRAHQVYHIDSYNSGSQNI
jgi:hypothetical protein